MHSPQHTAISIRKLGAPRSAFWYVGPGVLRPDFEFLPPQIKRAGILGSGPKLLQLVAGVRFELTTFGFWVTPKIQDARVVQATLAPSLASDTCRSTPLTRQREFN